MKKKKTVHLRRIRLKSENKVEKILFDNFKDYIKNTIRRNRIKNNILYTLILSNLGVTFSIVENYLKKFGFPKSYRFKKFKKIKKKSIRLFNKYKKKRFLYRKKLKSYHKFINFLRKKIKKIPNNNIIREAAVQFKKMLCLHFSYRHILQLPVRGQRTKTNARTRKNFNII